MFHKKLVQLTLLIISTVFLQSMAFAEFTPEENQAIADWEVVQKEYPQTTRFEKIDERTYQFVNKGIGYDGKLKLENVIIDKATSFDTQSAEFMVKLDVKADTFYQQENYSFSRWTQTNNLLFDKAALKWVRFNDYDFSQVSGSSSCKTKNTEKNKMWQDLFAVLFPIFIFIFIFLLFTRGKATKTMSFQEQYNEGIRSNDELTAEIKKLIEVLKDKNDSLK